VWQLDGWRETTGKHEQGYFVDFSSVEGNTSRCIDDALAVRMCIIRTAVLEINVSKLDFTVIISLLVE